MFIHLRLNYQFVRMEQAHPFFIKLNIVELAPFFCCLFFLVARLSLGVSINLDREIDSTYAEWLEVLKALGAVGKWLSIYYGWRPNLPDEGDNHLIELAVAGNAKAIVTYNTKDLQRGQLLWPQLQIFTPADCLRELL